MPILACVILVQGLGITALAVGFLAGAALRLGVHAFGLRDKLRWIGPPGRESRDDLIQLAWLMLPLVVGAAFSFVSELADNYFSSQIGEGGVSARAFAKKLRDLPLELAPYTLSVVLFPFFASMAATGDTGRLARLFATAAHAIAIVFAPLAVGMILLAEPLVSLALERGAFGAEARTLAASALAMYGIGMVTFAVETVLVNFFFALRDTLTPIAVGLFGVALNIALCALLIEPLGVAGVALALTLSKSVKLVVLAVLLPRKGPYLRWGALGAASLRLLAAAGVSALGLRAFVAAAEIDLAAAGTVAKAVHLSLGGAISLALFLATLAAVGRRERDLMLALPGFLRSIGHRPRIPR